MDNKKFQAILTLLINQVVNEIVCAEKKTEKEAVESLYGSQLYHMLEEEKTKLWHLSPKALYDLLQQEKTTGKIIFPEEA